MTSCLADPRCRSDFPPNTPEIEAVALDERGTVPSWKMLAVTYVSLLFRPLRALADQELWRYSGEQDRRTMQRAQKSSVTVPTTVLLSTLSGMSGP